MPAAHAGRQHACMHARTYARMYSKICGRCGACSLTQDAAGATVLVLRIIEELWQRFGFLHLCFAPCTLGARACVRRMIWGGRGRMNGGKFTLSFMQACMRCRKIPAITHARTDVCLSFATPLLLPLSTFPRPLCPRPPNPSALTCTEWRQQLGRHLQRRRHPCPHGCRCVAVHV